MKTIADMIIRKATNKDFPGMKSIDTLETEVLCHCPLDKLDKNVNNTDYYSYYRKYAKGKNKWCLVAEENKKIIGFLLMEIKKRPSYYVVKKIGYIDLLIVDKKQRRKKIGKKLSQEAKKIFKSKKLKYSEILVNTPNKTALKFWNREGFKEYRKEMFKKI